MSTLIYKSYNQNIYFQKSLLLCVYSNKKSIKYQYIVVKKILKIIIYFTDFNVIIFLRNFIVKHFEYVHLIHCSHSQ